MPIEGVSRSFKDISATFKVNPINRDMIILKNTNAIARSVRNLILTVPGERPFNPVLGSNINNLLFEPIDKFTSTAINSEIINTVTNFEPRIKVSKVTVTPKVDALLYQIGIQYTIIGLPVPAQELNFSLESTR